MRAIRAPAIVPFVAGVLLGWYAGVHGRLFTFGLFAVFAALVGAVLLMVSIMERRYGPGILGLAFFLPSLAMGVVLLLNERWLYGATLTTAAAVMCFVAARDLVRAHARGNSQRENTRTPQDNLS